MSTCTQRGRINPSVRNCWLLLLPLVLVFAQFDGNEAALFDGCDHEYYVNSTTYIESPYFPNYYPTRTSCRYRIIAPLDNYIVASCTILMDKGENACSTEFLYVARDGDLQLRGSEQFCGEGSFTRNSIFRTMTIAYASYGGRGRFQCRLDVRPQPCDCGWSVNSKIVSGQAAGVNEYTAMAALKDMTSNLPLFCDATIVSHYFVLTAAHCAQTQSNPANILVLVGDHDLSSGTESRYAASYRVSQIISHAGYTPDPATNDIALMRTTTAIEWSRGVGPICLPVTQASNNFAYKYVDIIGWGTTSFGGPLSSTLQKAQVMIVENSACEQDYQGVAPIYSSMICTYDYSGNNRDSCQFDSGGPVILRASRMFLVGCISFGKNCGGDKNAMGVNTRITSYLQWITDRIGATCPMNM